MPFRTMTATTRFAADYKCAQGCGAKIWKGQPVLVLQQGSHVPYDVRTLVYHVSCIQELLPSTPLPEAVTESQAVREIVAVYHALGQRLG